MMSNTTAETVPPEVAASQLVQQFSTGYIISSALQVVAKLKIADHLAAGPRTAAQLAQAAHVQEDALYRVLRTLASVGVFEERDARTFALNMPADLLRADAPGSVRDMVLWMTDPFHFRVYAEMLYSVQTGRPAVDKVYALPVFDHFAREPELSTVFNNAMTAFSATVIPAVLKSYDFSGIRVLVDVAGGHGEVLMSILRAYPEMHGVLFDLPHVVEGALPRIAATGLANRCQTASGDFFETVPRQGDAYIMKHIIHDWDDQRALIVLRNIRTALEGKPEGRLILLESVLQPGNQPDFGKIIDLEMLVLPGGRERTADELRALLGRAGFNLTAIVGSESPLSVVEARPV
jgi:hypothetical protein